MSCHVSSAHVCYVQVDEAELSPSAILNYMCTAVVDHLLGREFIEMVAAPFTDLFLIDSSHQQVDLAKVDL